LIHSSFQLKTGTGYTDTAAFSCIRNTFIINQTGPVINIPDTAERANLEVNDYNMETMILEEWFQTLQKTLEDAYLTHEEPWRQSGMSGPLDRWVSLRKPVADCMDKPGSFLDIGCANGFLLECCVKWTAERNIKIEPYGLDISEKLVELAKNRLPQYMDHFYVGNALTWIPQERYDFIRTELVYVPDEYEKQYVEFLLKNYLNPGGKLLAANYGEGLTRQDIERGIIKGSHATSDIMERLEELGFSPIGHKDGYDPIKSRRIRVAILDRKSLPDFKTGE
jgi:SAM-dependent methyltransferase